MALDEAVPNYVAVPTTAAVDRVTTQPAPDRGAHETDATMPAGDEIDWEAEVERAAKEAVTEAETQADVQAYSPQGSIWIRGFKRMGRPTWAPYWAGAAIDLYTTHDAMAACSTPQAIAAGWNCQEGNPLAGGDADAGRIAVTMGVGYGLSLLMESIESDNAKIPWWQELLTVSAMGTVRALVGLLHNAPLAAEIRQSAR